MPNKYNKQIFENKIYTFGLTTHYQLQKNFSKIELSLRQGCQLFTVYIFGSFCWLYLIQYSNNTPFSAYSKINFLFQDIFFETLPLLSEKGIIYGETNKNSSLINKENINGFNNENFSSSNKNIRFASLELTPFFSEKLQNYIGRKPFQSQRFFNSTWKNSPLLQKKDQCNLINSSTMLANTLAMDSSNKSISSQTNIQSNYSKQNSNLQNITKELVFFARKPLFIKVSTKSSINACCALQTQQNINICLKKQLLTQKKTYHLSGTSMIINPEVDSLPRKLEECFTSKTESFFLLPFEENRKKKRLGKGHENVFSLNFKPNLALTDKNVLWCNTLIKTRAEHWFGALQDAQFKTFQGLINSLPSSKKIRKPYLDARFDKNLKKAKTWFTHNSFQTKPLHLPLSFLQKKAKEGSVLVARPIITPGIFYRKNQHQHKLVEKSVLSYAFKNPSQILTEELLLESLFLKKKGFWKSKGHFIDIFNQPRLQSGFYFPNAPIIQTSKEKLKGGIGLTINPRLFFFKKSTVLAPQLKQSLSGAKFLIKQGTKETDFFGSSKLPFFKSVLSTISANSALQEKNFYKKNIFLEWLYQPAAKLEYLSFNRSNNKLINLQKKGAQFVVLDKHTDLKTSPCLLENFFSSQKSTQTFVEKEFSYKRNSFNGLVDAPESFFGTPYLKLGERFTIEKLKSKKKIETLYNIHSEDGLTSSQAKIVYSKPYASLGNSLKTVFGKKQFTISQNQNSKKSSKVQNLITNARLVTSWSKEPLAVSSFWSNLELRDNNSLNFNKNQKKTQKTANRVKHGTSSTNSSIYLPNIADKCFATNTILEEVPLSTILSSKRISGKANRNITLPFKYYNPGIKRERNIEDTLLVSEGYKKSRLFPTIHNDYRGIATRGLPLALNINKTIYTDQDVDLQSVLGGMRQRTEKQRIAENLSQPSPEKETRHLPEEYSTRKTNTVEKHIQQNKKLNLSSYYPLCTSLIVCPQKSVPQKALGPTNIVSQNLTDSFTAKNFKFQTKHLKGSIQTKGFYFEKLLCSNLQKIQKINFIYKGNGLPISPSFLAKILFFAGTWYSYKLLATPLSQSTQFLPATFTEAIGLQSFQQKYRIIKGENTRFGSSFKNLAGAEKTLAELRDLIWTFRLVGTGSPNHKHNLFTFFPYIGSRFGQSRRSVLSKSRNRLLLAGPPGTGKTLLVKALAAEANLPVIVQPVSSFRMISGVENPVSSLFHVARQVKPCIVFLDELDTLGNDFAMSTNNYTAEQKLGIKLARKYTYTLLLELDGLISSTRDLLVIGATNRIETLNPALTRAGRFDTILDFNLPSQDVRTALFSFYLGTEQIVQQHKKYKIQQKNTKINSNIVNKKQKKTYLKNINSNFKLNFLSKNSDFLLESYLAGKCYGLSHASISTIINESALESMLYRSIDDGLIKPLHTLETLEQAILKVKTLTAKKVQNTDTLFFKSTDVFGKPSKQDSFFTNDKNKLFGLTTELTSQKQIKNKDFFRSTSSNPFKSERVVNRIYKIVGSLIFYKKNQDNSFSRKTKKSLYKVSWFCETRLENESFFTSILIQPKLSTRKSQRNINQNVLPINRKDFQNVILQEYSGYASLSIYTAAKPLTFKILARAGLYQDPSYITTMLLTLRDLTLQGSFYTERSTFGSTILNQKLAKENFALSSASSITKAFFAKEAGFVSENSLSKVFFLDIAKGNSSSWSNLISQDQITEQPQKSLLFWKNSKGRLHTSKPFATDNGNFTKHSKQTSQALLINVKATNGLITNWFRIYFSRPFFRYDTFHYIENKEYYPKNNYILKRTKCLTQRNVATLSHTTIIRGASNSNFNSKISASLRTVKNGSDVTDSRFFEKKSLLKGIKENRQVKNFNSSAYKMQTMRFSEELNLNSAKQLPVITLKPNCFFETKESLYLAIVASIFHKSMQFFQKNRELTDYCAYIFLRYGVLYDFYLEAICEKF